ncbi:unnamed protein product [Musa acuminata subsp. malaccensis]|uniref:(wild Malaysian banana) hypothetical protein n=1 Tax=Musa acuminata subsp. malaccensis TaxID=214687 RepID=A0A8D6ZIT5_MUSAM|nr:unnamed protein product [Musa acuminata subsp. malaccensis]
MASSSGSVDYWRKFFRSANSDIFEVIEQAILVAASDCPRQFRSRRDQIVEKLFAALLPRCFGCDRVELRGAEGDGSMRRLGEKESKADSSNDGPESLNRAVSNYTYDEAEALTEEIEEEGQIVGEVMRIKEILGNQHDESDAVLLESLRRLQLMELSVDVLKATEIEGLLMACVNTTRSKFATWFALSSMVGRFWLMNGSVLPLPLPVTLQTL